MQSQESQCCPGEALLRWPWTAGRWTLVTGEAACRRCCTAPVAARLRSDFIASKILRTVTAVVVAASGRLMNSCCRGGARSTLHGSNCRVTVQSRYLLKNTAHGDGGCGGRRQPIDGLLLRGGQPVVDVARQQLPRDCAATLSFQKDCTRRRGLRWARTANRWTLSSTGQG